MKAVRFTRGLPPYNRGEVAGFPDADAQKLIDRGIAEPLKGGEDVKTTAMNEPPRTTAMQSPKRTGRTRPSKD